MPGDNDYNKVMANYVEAKTAVMTAVSFFIYIAAFMSIGWSIYGWIVSSHG